jgi:hypothetical protein
MFVRIIATPPGEAPEEVRRAWVGLELPLAAGENGPRTIPVGGVLTGARTFWGKLFKLLTGQRRYGHGYVVDAAQALVLLAERAPWAAQWWRECAPHCWQPGFLFLFPAACCAEAAQAWPAVPGRVSSAAFFPAPAAEVTPRPTSGPASERVTTAPLPPEIGSGGLRSGGTPESECRLFVFLEGFGWIAGVSSVFFALADFAARRPALLGLRLAVLAVGLALVWLSRKALRQLDREAEALRRMGPGSSDRAPPDGAAGPVVEPTLAPAPFWGESRLVQRSPDRMEVVPALSLALLGLFIAVGAPLICWFLTRQALLDTPPWPRSRTVGLFLLFLPLLQLLAIAFAALGLTLLTRRASLDRRTGEVRLAWLFRERVACRIGDVRAVQVVRQGPSAQINLVLDGPGRARVNVGATGQPDTRGEALLWCGRRLAVFLGVPLVDQTNVAAVRLTADGRPDPSFGTSAVVSPVELGRLLGADRRAGPHNTQLSHTGAGVLELRPVPQRGMPLTDLLGRWPFQRACAVVKFDRNRGRPARLFVGLLAGSGLRRLPAALRKPRPLDDVAAVELVPNPPEDGPDQAPGPSCRLQLLLRDAGCPVLELAPQAEPAWARDTGDRLARFLGVPLLDRTALS